MPFRETKILEVKQYLKSDKTQIVIYADLESLKEKIDWCKNNPKESSTTKATEHILPGFLISISSFKDRKYAWWIQW